MPVENQKETVDILTAVKKSLRINNSDLDDDVRDLIEACKQELLISGVASTLINEEDPLIRQAIKTYCKAHFGYDNPDAERFLKSYGLLRDHLAIAYLDDNEVG